jgi:membrane glycosyltransferase
MDLTQFTLSNSAANEVAGLVIASVALASWALVFILDPDGRYLIPAWVMLLLSMGMALVSAFAVTDVEGLVGIFAAVNRTLVAGYGIITLYRVLRLRGHLRRLGRRDS